VHLVFKSGSSVLRLFLSFVSDCALSIVNHYCVVSSSITFPPPTNFWLPTKRKFWGPMGFSHALLMPMSVCRCSLHRIKPQYNYTILILHTLHKFANLVYIYMMIMSMSNVLAHDFCLSSSIHVHIFDNTA
jgi:hypothetical protein